MAAAAVATSTAPAETGSHGNADPSSSAGEVVAGAAARRGAGGASVVGGVVVVVGGTAVVGGGTGSNTEAGAPWKAGSSGGQLRPTGPGGRC